MSAYRIIEGDLRDRLGDLEPGSVQTCVTSPPYWGLRDYGDDGQLGLEPTPERYVENLVSVFREVKRVLRDDGTHWLNLGDSYASTGGEVVRPGKTAQTGNTLKTLHPDSRVDVPPGLKPKDLVGIPWMVAFALRADGWYLRSDIIWAKPNPMPESVTDRPTKAHEYLFLLSKSPRYYYDADAIREEHAPGSIERIEAGFKDQYGDAASGGYRGAYGGPNGEQVNPAGRNKRSVWTVTTQPFPGAHFATFPPKLIEPCVLAGSPPKCCGECGGPWERVTEAEQTALRDTHLARKRERNVGGRTDGYTQLPAGGVIGGNRQTRGWKATCYHADSSAPDDSRRPIVLDPFAGSGTTGVVALRHDRDFVGIELNPAYAQMARNRIYDDGPLLNVEATNQEDR